MSKDLKRKRFGARKGVLSKKKQKVLSGKEVKSVRTERSAIKVRDDALKWREVALPDRLEDAEGFYGLEEIEDVDVVKDESTGLVSFQPRQAENVIEFGADEEWSGFVDEDKNTKKANLDDSKTQVPPHSDVTAKEDSAAEKIQTKTDLKLNQKVNKKPKKQKNARAAEVVTDAKTGKQQTNEVEQSTDFAALRDIEDEEEELEVADVAEWMSLDLSSDILSAISTLGFANPTPIQKAAIPPISEGHDVIGKAVTGSGKTLAFGIPIVERWLETQQSQSKKANASSKNISVPVAFILAPTRELAHQLSKHLTNLCQGLAAEHGPRIATVTGGLSVIKQQRQLETADIIIGTPGRLWEVINSSHGLIDRLKQIQFLVIDEADRLLSEGHFKEVDEILNVLNRKVINDIEIEGEGEDEEEEDEEDRIVSAPLDRQTLVFSATFHKELQQKLAGKQRKWRPAASNDNLLSNTQSLDYLLRKLKFQKGKKPIFVDANPTSQMAENLTESILECGAMQKDLYIYSLLLWQQHEHQKFLRRQSHQSSNTGKKDSANNAKVTRTLVFTNSISSVKRLVPLLQTLSIPNTLVLPLHSTMPQKSRLRSLERFTTPPSSSSTNTKEQTTTSILISTDVAARGLDIKGGIDTIIHYHVPRTADMYVHRSGRTARGNNTTGRSILICSPEETAGVTRLISKVHSNQQKSTASALDDEDHNNNNNDDNSNKKSNNPIKPLLLPSSLPTQLSHRITLAQNLTNAQSSTSKSKSNSSWLRTAASDLGVDYSSSDFEETSKRNNRGRGGGRATKQQDTIRDVENGKIRAWKEELKVELFSKHNNNKIDFGDGEGLTGGRGKGRFLAGGSVDVERLLREGV